MSAYIKRKIKITAGNSTINLQCSLKIIVYDSSDFYTITWIISYGKMC